MRGNEPLDQFSRRQILARAFKETGLDGECGETDGVDDSLFQGNFLGTELRDDVRRAQQLSAARLMEKLRDNNEKAALRIAYTTMGLMGLYALATATACYISEVLSHAKTKEELHNLQHSHHALVQTLIPNHTKGGQKENEDADRPMD